MLTVNKCLAGGQGLAAALLRRAAVVALDWGQRQRSRLECVDDRGRPVAVFLPRGTVIRGGDVLVAVDGTVLRVQAAPQPVLRVAADAAHGTPVDLTCAAYHLGNRHVALEVQVDHLKIEPDPVLADMLRLMHLRVTEAMEPFDPLGGAYSAGSVHGHGHGRDHGHDHQAHHDHHADRDLHDHHEPRHGHDPRHPHPAQPAPGPA